MIVVTWTLVGADTSSHIQSFQDDDTRLTAEFLMALKLSKNLALVSVAADGPDALKVLDRVAKMQAQLIKEIEHHD